MRADGGYLIVTRDDGQVREYKTSTCFHCNSVIIHRPGQVPDGGWCGMCMKAICGPCCDDGRCTPFEEKLAQQEKREAAGRALSAALGLR